MFDNCLPSISVRADIKRMGLGEHTDYAKYILFLVINRAIKIPSYKIRVMKGNEINCDVQRSC